MCQNKNRHLKLLRLKDKYEQLKKVSSNEATLAYLERKLDENFDELLDCSTMMVSYLHWSNRAHYYELIEKFLNGPIDFDSLKS